MSFNCPVPVVAFHVDPVSRKERLAPWEAWAEISELIWNIVSGGRQETIYPVRIATTEGANWSYSFCT